VSRDGTPSAQFATVLHPTGFQIAEQMGIFDPHGIQSVAAETNASAVLEPGRKMPCYIFEPICTCSTRPLQQSLEVTIGNCLDLAVLTRSLT